jgi:hypothetical protein
MVPRISLPCNRKFSKYALQKAEKPANTGLTAMCLDLTVKTGHDNASLTRRNNPNLGKRNRSRFTVIGSRLMRKKYALVECTEGREGRNGRQEN